MTERDISRSPAPKPAAIVTTDAPTERLPRNMRIIVDLGRRLSRGSLLLTLPGGRKMTITGSEPGPKAEMTVHRTRLARRYLLGGHLAFAEAYLDGDWDSPDVTTLLHYFLVNERGMDMEGSFLTRMVERVVHAWRRNSRRGSRKNIAYHYDLGNEFYRLWLDPSMTYSSAVFSGPADQPLEDAQREKYRRMADLVGLQPGHRVLEIGCGWGGFAEYAAKERGASVVGLTLSTEQLAFARDRLDKAGVGAQCDLRLQDYRDVTGDFDAVVSIEMIEAVGERYWPAYFGKIRDVLKPGGKAAIQAITIEDRRFPTYRASPDFIQRYVFPGGMLLPPMEILRQAKQASLRLLSEDGFRLDYARTLKAWRDRFVDRWPEIARMGFDARFKRMWEYYLCYCEAGFTYGSIDVRQIALARE